MMLNQNKYKGKRQGSGAPRMVQRQTQTYIMISLIFDHVTYCFVTSDFKLLNSLEDSPPSDFNVLFAASEDVLFASYLLPFAARHSN